MIDVQIKNKVSYRFICKFTNISSNIRMLTIIHDTLPFKYDKVSLNLVGSIHKDINLVDVNKNYLLCVSYKDKLIIISDSISGKNIIYSDSLEIPLYYYEERFNEEYKDQYEIPEEASTSSGLTGRFKKFIMSIIILLGMSLIGLCIIKSN
jgi:hypothetical protein